MMEVTDKCTDIYGQNVPYTMSMDFSYLPHLIVFLFTDEEKERLGIIDIDSSLADLRFLADNGRVLPKKLRNSTLDEIRDYVVEHKKYILGTVEGIFRHYQFEEKLNI